MKPTWLVWMAIAIVLSVAPAAVGAQDEESQPPASESDEQQGSNDVLVEQPQVVTTPVVESHCSESPRLSAPSSAASGDVFTVTITGLAAGSQGFVMASRSQPSDGGRMQFTADSTCSASASFIVEATGSYAITGTGTSADGATVQLGPTAVVATPRTRPTVGPAAPGSCTGFPNVVVDATASVGSAFPVQLTALQPGYSGTLEITGPEYGGSFGYVVAQDCTARITVTLPRSGSFTLRSGAPTVNGGTTQFNAYVQVRPTAAAAPPPSVPAGAALNPFDFSLIDVHVFVDRAVGSPPSESYQVLGVVRNDGAIAGTARVALATADNRPPTAVEVGSDGAGGMGRQNIQPGEAVVFRANGTLQCDACHFATPPFDEVIVTVQGAFVR